MSAADLEFADSVRDLVGWNQTRADWERFLATEPDGCFIAEWNGVPVGTATTTVYSPALAWIGMVLVHPEWRRRGVGQALLNHCLGYLHGRSIRCIKLDATPAGAPVYAALGFRPERTLARWERAPGKVQGTGDGIKPRPWHQADTDPMLALDAGAFGADRARVLRALLAAEARVEVAAVGRERLGFGVLRAGARARYLGPVVASSPAAGLAVVAALVKFACAAPIFWDILDENRAATTWAQAHGFMVQRRLTRMYLGTEADAAAVAGCPEQIFALAGPEIG